MGEQGRPHPVPGDSGSDAGCGPGIAGRTLDDFEGTWRIDRRIDQQAGPAARLTGRAEWRRDALGLVCTETGLLQIDGQAPMRAERRYLWRACRAGRAGPASGAGRSGTAGLDVWFEDGRFFHHVPLAGGLATHLCPPDRYVVRYDFAAWPAFRTTWWVSGPRKAYRIVTVFAPAR